MSRRKKKHKTVEVSAAGSDLAVEDKGSFICPFCGGKIIMASSGDDRMVLHTMPPCSKYLKEDALVFLRNARVKAFGAQPDDDEWPVVPPTGKKDN